MSDGPDPSDTSPNAPTTEKNETGTAEVSGSSNPEPSELKPVEPAAAEPVEPAASVPVESSKDEQKSLSVENTENVANESKPDVQPQEPTETQEKKEPQVANEVEKSEENVSSDDKEKVCVENNERKEQPAKTENVTQQDEAGKPEEIDNDSNQKGNESSADPTNPKADDGEQEHEDEQEPNLDDDEVKTNPAYIPKSGQFYMHDVRSTADSAEQGDDENGQKKSRADGKWSHDLFDERKQKPKTSRELENQYGYDIRREHGVPEEEERGSGAPFRTRKPPTRQLKEKRQLNNDSGEQFQKKPGNRLRTFKRTTRSDSNAEGNHTMGDNVETKNLSQNFNNLSLTKPLPKREARPPMQRPPHHGNNAPQRGMNMTMPNKMGGPPIQMVPPNAMPPPIHMVPMPAVPVPMQPQAFMRQPTGAVYFDPSSHVHQGPPPQPRERRRLKFVAPTQ